MKIMRRLAVYTVAVLMQPYFFALGIRELWRAFYRRSCPTCGGPMTDGRCQWEDRR